MAEVYYADFYTDLAVKGYPEKYVNGDVQWIRDDHIKNYMRHQNRWYARGNGTAVVGLQKSCAILPTNCKNCGAPLRSTECEYCRTHYS